MRWHPMVLGMWTRDDIQIKSELEGGKWEVEIYCVVPSLKVPCPTARYFPLLL